MARDERVAQVVVSPGQALGLERMCLLQAQPVPQRRFRLLALEPQLAVLVKRRAAEGVEQVQEGIERPASLSRRQPEAVHSWRLGERDGRGL